MSKTKSQQHHWWPKCVSREWADPEGGVHWLRPDGSEQRAKPASYGVIGNGHFIKMANTPGETTPWDQNYETFFQQADNEFPTLISWLKGLGHQNRSDKPNRQRFLPQTSTDEQFARLVEGIVSLAIRSPKTRESAVTLAEHFRGQLPERERNSLIAINLRGMHHRAVRAFGTRGKATAIFSPDREFIFGDGFYHNLNSPSTAPSSPRILVPLTPTLSVLYTIPMQYQPDPRLSTLVISAEEAAKLNEVVQVYARQMIFYRTDKPDLIDDYRAAKHLQYSSSHNIVENLIHTMPGVQERGASLDFLMKQADRPV